MAAFTSLSTGFIAQNPDLIAGLLVPLTPGLVFDPGSLAVIGGLSSIGTYDGSLAPLGIGAGLIITTGTMPGTTNTAGFFGISNGMAGDAMLDAVVNTVFPTFSYDATTISLSFTVNDPTISGVSFNIVFGSDEFPEWVNQFVDIGAIWVNGVDVAYFNNDPKAPLSVIGSNLSANYFINNTGNLTTSSVGGVARPGVASLLPIEYDGVSAPLTVFAPVHQGANTLKIGIADTRDHIYDSGLIISNMMGTSIPVIGITRDIDGTGDNDLLEGTADRENIHGQAGDDDIRAGGGDDVIQAGDGNDFITAGAGNDFIDGGAGIDAAVYSGASTDYTITTNADGSITVTDQRAGAPDGTDTLLNVEIAQFINVAIDLATMLETTKVAPPAATRPIGAPLPLTPPDIALPAGTAGIAGFALEDGEPVITDAFANISADETTLTITGLPAALPVGITFNAATHSFVLNPADAAFQSLAAAETMTLKVDYSVTNATGATATSASFTVTGVNDAPVVAAATTAAATEDGASVTITALAMASDVDHAATLAVVALAAATAVEDPGGHGGKPTSIPTTPTPATSAFDFGHLPPGVTFDSATSSFTLNPADPAYQFLAAGKTLAVTINYGVTDGLATTPASAIFTVTGTNDAPVVSGPVTGMTVVEDAAPVEDGPSGIYDRAALLANAADPDAGDHLSIVVDKSALPAGVTYQHTDPTTTTVVGDFFWYGIHTPILTTVYTAEVDTLTIDPSNAAFQSLAHDEALDLVVNYGITDGIATTPVPVIFNVIGTNDAPVVAGEMLAAASEDGTPVTINALRNATDIDHGAVLSVAVAPSATVFGNTVADIKEALCGAAFVPGVPLGLSSLPAGVTFDAATNRFAIDPSNPAYQSLSLGEVRAVTIAYGVTDGIATTPATAVFNVTGTNDAPVVTGSLAFSAVEDAAAAIINPLANATDLDQLDILKLVPGPLPSGVRLVTVPGGYYQPDVTVTTFNPGDADFQSLAQGEVATFAWNYDVTDGHATAPASAVFTVTGVNDAPRVTGAMGASVLEDAAPITVDALSKVIDVDHGALMSVVSLPAALPVGVSYDAASHSFTFDPAASVFQPLAQGEKLTVSVAYGVTDGIATTPAHLYFTITGVNDAPVVTGPVTGTANEDGAVSSVNALGNASDIDDIQGGHALHATGIPAVLPAGVIFNAATQRFSLNPANAAYQSLSLGETRDVTIDYSVSDGYVDVPTSVVFSVTGRNDAPVVSGPVLAAVAESAAPVAVNLLANTSDIDGLDMLAVRLGGGSSVTASVASGSWTTPIAFTLAGNQVTLDPAQFTALRAGETVDVAFAYTVTDGNPGGTAPAGAHVVVTGVNNAPTAAGVATAHIAENTAPGTIVSALSSTDADRNDIFSYALLSDTSGFFAVSGGNLVVAAGAAIDYETVTSDIITLRTTDSAGATTSSTITMAIDNVAGVTLTGGSGGDIFTPLSAVPTTGEEDTVSGNNGNDTIDGGAGADVLNGNSGDDLIIGGTGNDTITGGVGADTMSGGDGNDRFVITGTEGVGDVINGGNGTDTLVAAGSSALTLSGFNATAASIEELEGNAKGMTGTAASEAFDLSGISLITGTGMGFLDAGDGNDTVTGTGFADDLRGGAGADSIHGGAGNDVLNGGSGADRLFGDTGNDTMSGGADADIFVFDAGFGQDLILDLTFGTGTTHDTIDFNQAIFADFTAVKAAMGQSGTDVVITAGADMLTIRSTTIAGLVSADFQFH